MGVRVDHAGGDDLACEVQHLTRGFGGDRRFDRGDNVAADADIGHVVAPRSRVDHPSAA